MLYCSAGLATRCLVASHHLLCILLKMRRINAGRFAPLLMWWMVDAAFLRTYPWIVVRRQQISGGVIGCDLRMERTDRVLAAKLARRRWLDVLMARSSESVVHARLYVLQQRCRRDHHPSQPTKRLSCSREGSSHLVCDRIRRLPQCTAGTTTLRSELRPRDTRDFFSHSP